MRHWNNPTFRQPSLLFAADRSLHNNVSAGRGRERDVATFERSVPADFIQFDSVVGLCRCPMFNFSPDAVMLYLELLLVSEFRIRSDLHQTSSCCTNR